ncbi:MAG: threonine--tRNA ligase [Phyllobacteriaceae bacterium]|nr:threonine--tRNA ligase [Phyllobacteriaceae bacterium]
MSIKVTFPDGAARDYSRGTTGTEIVEGISKSLAKKTVAMKWNGVLSDLSDALNEDGKIEFVTRDSGSKDVLELIRHDAAHVLAEAVQELWPDTQVTIGPVIENGFYYDFYREAGPFTEDELRVIEKKMSEIIDRGAAFTKEVWTRDQAKEWFAAKGEAFKVELVDAIPADQSIKMYKQGQWMDLCRGPHMRTVKDVGQAFKLTKVAGAYWRGDSNREVLSRIYGTAFATKEELEAYLHMVEEAEKRDHRKLGREMNLFHMQEEAPGQVFWHPKGWSIYVALQDYMRRKQRADGYVEVNTPQVVSRKLWEESGHWDNYQENMFIVEVDEEHAKTKAINALKPMNCPCHVQVFNHGLKSYRDLPLRMAEFGSCNRYEPSGALHGIMRVRGFTQDDAHIFCTEDQIEAETKKFIDLLASVYADLGFEGWRIKLSTRPEKRIGSEESWDRAEAALGNACKAAGHDYTVFPGEGAFYGPKLEFVLTDAIGRDWQCGTLQVDPNLPERLDAEYVGADGAKHRPIMLHRAVLGSFERFIGILIENSSGKLPMWLAPTQVVVTTIVSEADEYAEKLVRQLREAGIRAEIDTRNEKINYKVREHSVGKVPLLFVVGKREAEEGNVSIRRLGTEGQQVRPFAEALAELVAEATPPDLRQKAEAAA